MKTKVKAEESWPLPESPAERAARRGKLKRILRKGLGLKPAELKNAIRPGYLETYRVMEDPAPYGRRRSRR